MDFIYSLLLIFPDKYGSSNSIIFAVKDKELENTSAVFIAYKYEMKVKLCPENVPAVWNKVRKFLFKEHEFRALKSRIYGKKSPINQNVKFRFYSTQKKMIIKMFIYNITSVPWGYCYQKVQKKKKMKLLILTI